MKKLLLALVFAGFATCANAATCFWVGGTGSWSTANTASWASGTGGTGGTCAATGGIPKQAADTATFDGASGGGTVTVDTTINGVTLTTITMGAFTGTLDFSVNNPTITLSNQFSVTGTGVRTLKLGSSTINLTAANAAIWDATTVTNLTFNAGTSNITWQPSSFGANSNFNTGGLTYATITLGSTSFGTAVNVQNNGPTVAHLNLVGALRVFLPTMTISNAISWAGTSAGLIVVLNSTAGPTPSTVTLSATGNTMAWTALGGITFATNAPVASNSFNLGNVTNATINNPVTVAGGSRCIGC